jgi:hypothetical protein
MYPTVHLEDSEYLVRSGPGVLLAALLTAGPAAASLTILDSTTNSGQPIAIIKAPAGTSYAWIPPGGQVAVKGLYAVKSDEDATAFVVYR